MIILVDMDDTIEELLPAWCRWLNKYYGTNVSPDNVTDWEVAKFFPELTIEQVFSPLIDNSSFWKTVKPKPGAVKYLKKLATEGNEIYIVTASHYKNIAPKYEYIIEKYFPFIHWNHFIITCNKQLINGDVLIDDGPHNLENGSYNKILFTAPHNKSYDTYKNNMYRADCWKDVYNIVHELQGSQK